MSKSILKERDAILITMGDVNKSVDQSCVDDLGVIRTLWIWKL